MNVRARNLVAALSGILGTLPGAHTLAFCTGYAWALVEIHVVTEGAARLLAADLELGPPQRSRAEGRRWLRMEASSGDVRLVVVGPQEADPSSSEEPSR